MNKELEIALDVLRPVVYIISEEEDRLIKDIYEKTKKNSDLFIYRSTSGICNYDDYCTEPERKEQKGRSNTTGFIQTLQEIYKAAPTEKRAIFVLLDVDHYLTGTTDASQNVIRKLKDVVLQVYQDQVCVKTILIISSDLVIPRKLQRYVEVVYDDLPVEAEIESKAKKILEDYNSTIEKKEDRINVGVNASMIRSLKGLTHFEIEQITLTSAKLYKGLNSEAVEIFKGSILKKTNVLELLDTGVTFDEIGGMNKLKQWLTEREGAWTEEGIKAKIPLLKGVLLLGITGCGKTLIARSIANLWDLPLIQFNPSKVFSPRVGESEGNILKVLKIAESISPCVMFIDEIEKQFAGSQSSSFSDAGTTSRVIGSFLSWYQDNTRPIFIVATCNSVEYLPPEMVSRFDDKFFVNIPTFNERKKIFEIQLNKHKSDWQKDKVSLDELAKESSQMTGREIEQVIKSSIHIWFHDVIKNDPKICYQQKHIMKVLTAKVPIVRTMENEINYLVQWVGWDDKKKEGLRANWANEREDGDDIDQMLKEIMDKPSVLDKNKRKQ